MATIEFSALKGEELALLARLVESGRLRPQSVDPSEAPQFEGTPPPD